MKLTISELNQELNEKYSEQRANTFHVFAYIRKRLLEEKIISTIEHDHLDYTCPNQTTLIINYMTDDWKPIQLCYISFRRTRSVDTSYDIYKFKKNSINVAIANANNLLDRTADIRNLLKAELETENRLNELCTNISKYINENYCTEFKLVDILGYLGENKERFIS